MSSDTMTEFLPEQQRTDRIIAAVRTACNQIGRSMAQVALAWLRRRPVPVIPIIGARKLSQLQDNLASFDLTLSADQLRTLDAASRVERGFPHGLYAKEMVRTFAYGGLRDQILA
jgi:aryl-alcohol dehydrogenase-like predicted oxidoreductase